MNGMPQQMNLAQAVRNPQQVGSFGGVQSGQLAPWLRQGQGALPGLQPTPGLGQGPPATPPQTVPVSPPAAAPGPAAPPAQPSAIRDFTGLGQGTPPAQPSAIRDFTGLGPAVPPAQPSAIRDFTGLGQGTPAAPAAPQAAPQAAPPVQQSPLAYAVRDFNFAGTDKGYEDMAAQEQASREALASGPAYARKWSERAERARASNPTKPPLYLDEDNAPQVAFGSDFSGWYDKAHGKGALSAEANRYGKGLFDKDPTFANARGVNFNDPAAVEAFFREQNRRGAIAEFQQDVAAQNKRDDRTGALMMSALAGGLGAAAGAGAAAAGSTPIASGIGGATFNASAPLLGTAGTVAGGMYDAANAADAVGGLARQSNLANAVRSSAAPAPRLGLLKGFMR